MERSKKSGRFSQYLPEKGFRQDMLNKNICHMVRQYIFKICVALVLLPVAAWGQFYTKEDPITENITVWKAKKPFYRAGGKDQNIAQVELENRTILIDPGSRWLADDIVAYYDQSGKDSVEIWISHAHPDHAGNIGLLQQQKPEFFKFVCSNTDTALLQNPEKFLDHEYHAAGSFKTEIFPSFLLFIDTFVQNILYGSWEAIKVDDTYENLGMHIAGIKIVDLPGHTPGSVGFVIDGEKKVMIIGDLFQHRKNKGEEDFILSFNLPRAELDDALASMEKIKSEEPDILVAGHGEIMFGKHFIQSLIDSTIKRYKKYQNKLSNFVDVKNKILPLEEIFEECPFAWTKAYSPPFIEKRSHTLAVLKTLYRQNNISDEIEGAHRLKAISERKANVSNAINSVDD